jgi:transcriptional regulator with XRE-family HTH domain
MGQDGNTRRPANARLKEGLTADQTGKVRRLVATRLREWMNASEDLKTGVAVAHRSGVGQTTISRILRMDTDVCADKLFLIAAAFNRDAGDLLRADPKSGMIAYERERYARLPVWEKARVEAFIANVIAENTRP